MAILMVTMLSVGITACSSDDDDDKGYYGYENETIFFVIEGKTMSLFEHYYYDDLEWILTKQ